MEMKKRECPLAFELIPEGAGCTTVYFKTGSERLRFNVSNVMNDHLNVNHILYLKAYALDCMEVRRLRRNRYEEDSSSDFNAEMDLLMLDM